MCSLHIFDEVPALCVCGMYKVLLDDLVGEKEAFRQSAFCQARNDTLRHAISSMDGVLLCMK